MTKYNSTHILNTSANLLGFCLIVLTSLKISSYRGETLIDEFTGVACILLAGSCLFSFLSIRTKKEAFLVRFENIADNIFIVALLFIFLITIMIAFSFIL